LAETFVFFLQNLFREFEEGSGVVWRPDEEDTDILITTEKPRLEAVEKVPHIVCVIGAMKWTGAGLDQLQGLNYRTGTRKHTDLIPGTCTYHCMAREGIPAGDIAWLASFYTNAYRRAMMGSRGGGLHNVGVTHDLSPESPPTAYVGPTVNSEIVEVRVTVPFFWQPQWTSTPQNVSRFDKIRFFLQAELLGVGSGRQTKLSPPQYKGRPIKSLTPIDQEVRS